MEDLFGGFGETAIEDPEVISEQIGSGVVFASEVEFLQYPGAVNCVHECFRPKPSSSTIAVAHPIDTTTAIAHPSSTMTTVAAPKGAVADVATPNGVAAREAARTYAYTLDPFQTEAISCLENQESVLVAAHTSAGKTTVAEYAIAMALRDKQRVIFTSPIKALSNQKFRDFQEQYSDVGLLTGDVSINPNGSIMIMTTEILRSMLYRGGSLVREVGWVIFDEVHYMRDRERGVVWEETMILLPDTVRFVFLSATIPNSREFAEWICRIKHQPCHIIYTDYRPVPLQHYVFPAGGDGVYLVVDEKKKFNEENFAKACRALEAEGDGGGAGGGGGSSWSKKMKREASNKADLLKVLRLCQEKQFLPLIVFAFSKKECEQNAVILKRQDLTTDTEKQVINEVFTNALQALDPEDANLPQIQSMLPLLLRGIAVHHSGLLPILKEVIEILFCENLIKVLFCTETFAMGLNAPAKVVVFSNFSKWDGTERRVISSGEYIQMAGRAGRRGKDDKGLAIVMMTDKIEPEMCKNVMIGEALRLDSQFYLSYNMLLNLYRLEGADVGYLVERSFSQFQRNKGVVEVKSRIAEAEFELGVIEEKLEAEQKGESATVVGAMAELYEDVATLRKTTEELRGVLTTPKYLLTYLNAGRLVKLRSGQWVVLLRVQEDKQRNTVLNIFDKDEERNIPIAQVAAVATIRANIPDTNLKAALSVQLDKIVNHERFRETGLPLMDPVKDMKIPECEVAHFVTAIADLKDKIAANSIYQTMATALNTNLEGVSDFFSNSTAVGAWREQTDQVASDASVVRYVHLFLRRMSVLHSLEELRKESSRSQSLVLREELRAMRRVLRRMNYIDANNVLTDKGKLGCEVSSCDEVLLTEMVFNNVFEGLSADEIVGLLSCLVLDEKSEDTALPEDVERSALGKALAKTREIAVSVADVMTECRVPDFDGKVYIEKVKTQMILPVSLWLSGKSFKDVMEATSLFEGSVVRVMRRLEELVREVCLAAKAIGHNELENRLIEARKRLRRGIVFAASLYI